MSCSKCDKLFKENHLEVLNVLKVLTMHPVAPLDIYFLFALVKWLPTRHLPTIRSDYHFSQWPQHFHNSSSVKTFVPVNTSVWKQAATSAHQNYRPWRFLFITISKKKKTIPYTQHTHSRKTNKANKIRRESERLKLPWIEWASHSK